MSTPIYVLAGQSNAGSLTQTIAWQLASEPSETYTLTSVFQGGTSLAPQPTKNDWFPFDDGDANTGELLEALNTEIDAALLADENAYLAGVIWVQGEADSSSVDNATNYGERLTELHGQLEARYGATFDFVVSYLPERQPVGNGALQYSEWQTLREEQIAFAEGNERVIAVDPDAAFAQFAITEADGFRDQIHYSEQLSSALLRSALDQLGVAQLMGVTAAIAGEDTSDTIAGTALSDMVFGRDGDDALEGGEGRDELIGGRGADVLRGGAGADVLTGGRGRDLMIGGAEDDRYYVDVVTDRIVESANGGFDTVFTSTSWRAPSGVEEVIASGATSAVRLDGSDDGNTITGSAFDDILFGWAGDDVLEGEDGNDTIRGQDGNDRLDGGLGSDLMIGGLGDDLYVVTEQSDQAIERIGEGFDTISSRVDFRLIGKSEIEVLTLHQSAGNAGLQGNQFGQVVRGNSGSNVLSGGDGDDELVGLAGIDLLGGGPGDDIMRGGGDADTLIGNEGSDSLFGDEGDDRLVGGDDNDELSGGAGNDRLLGGNGNDVIAGGDGDDIGFGGAGNDTFHLVAALNADNANEYYGGNGTDTLVLHLTEGEYDDAAIRADIDAIRAGIEDNVSFDYDSASLGLSFADIEAIQIIVDGETI